MLVHDETRVDDTQGLGGFAQPQAPLDRGAEVPIWTTGSIHDARPARQERDGLCKRDREGLVRDGGRRHVEPELKRSEVVFGEYRRGLPLPGEVDRDPRLVLPPPRN
jgi:hypothetical protein